MATIVESDVIAGVSVAEPDIFGDERGLFIETYRRQWFANGRAHRKLRRLPDETCT